MPRKCVDPVRASLKPAGCLQKLYILDLKRICSFSCLDEITPERNLSISDLKQRDTIIGDRAGIVELVFIVPFYSGFIQQSLHIPCTDLSFKEKSFEILLNLSKTAVSCATMGDKDCVLIENVT